MDVHHYDPMGLLGYSSGPYELFGHMDIGQNMSESKTN